MQFQAYTLEKDPSWAAVYITAPPPKERNPIHLCILLDVSWPMNDNNKLESVILSIQMLLEFLSPYDTISLITFSNHATIILNRMEILSEEKENIRRRLSIIQTDDAINIGDAIIRAQEVLHNDTSIKQGIVLLTNGHATMGMLDTSLLSMTTQLLTDFPGTSLSTIGYGLHHNKDLLQAMATQGGGSYSTVGCLQDIVAVLGDIVGGLISCIAKQVCVILPKGTAHRSRYPVLDTETEMEVMIGDLPAELEVVFFVKLSRGQPISLKGYDFTIHEYFNTTTNIIDIYTEEINRNSEIHSLRCNVVHMIDEVALSKHWNEELRTTKKIEITRLLSDIYKYRPARSHYIWELMIHELKECIYFLNRPYLQFHANNLYQNICVLGQQRGIPFLYMHEGNLIHLNSFYSNNIQRRLSMQLLKIMNDIHIANNVKLNDTSIIRETRLLPPLIMRQHPMRFENRTVIEYINMNVADVVHASR